jgi:3-oxoacyl-[acyl-carrier protein] reductase
MKFKNNSFVVTGAAQGLGRAIALMLASREANVALLDVSQEGLAETMRICREQGVSAQAYICDVSSEDDVIKTFDKIVSDFSNLSGLINNAGILRDGLMVKVKDGKLVDRLSLQQWQQVIDVNLTGVFLCGREFASRMVTTGNQGVIVNISSISRAGNAGQSNYAAAKAGVAALTTTWAKELARFKIRCAAIAPGVFETEMVTSMKSEAYERITAAIPLKRTGEVEELADTVGFIIGNDYVNGRIIELDGGLRL